MTRHCMLIVLAGAVTFACGGEKPAATPPATTGAAPAGTLAPAAGGDVGVAECDDFLRKYEACLGQNVPATVKPQLQEAINQYRKTWRSIAAQPSARASLAGACRQAADTTKVATSAYGCQW